MSESGDRLPALWGAALAVVLTLALACPASHADEPSADLPDDGATPGAETGPPVPAEPETPTEYRCDQPGSDGSAMIDRMQRGVYLSVCGSARWFDGLFGTRRYDQDSDATFGRLGLYEFWDDRDGLDTRLRLRARLALPTLENRLQLLFGRVDDREIIEDSRAQGATLPSSFARVEDEAWLLGLGYSKQSRLENGFDFGAGIRIRTPVDPYVKGTYRHNFIFSDATTLRARQTVFWRDSRGLGETTEIDLDHLLSPRLLLRWDNTGTVANDVGRLEWSTAMILFQSLGERRAISYTSFVAGILNDDVPVRDYGVELRYRQQVFRKWLFLDLRSGLTWPKSEPEEDRDINPGVGIGFEMYFGPVPESNLR